MTRAVQACDSNSHACMDSYEQRLWKLKTKRHQISYQQDATLPMQAVRPYLLCTPRVMSVIATRMESVRRRPSRDATVAYPASHRYPTDPVSFQRVPHLGRYVRGLAPIVVSSAGDRHCHWHPRDHLVTPAECTAVGLVLPRLVFAVPQLCSTAPPCLPRIVGGVIFEESSHRGRP